VHGADRIEILFSANPGQSPKSLKKVASGGELSRLSLAMIIASADPNQTLTRIFDEIDAGIGGETAHKVGEFLHQTGQQGQSLCVTHLAQVAARADFQLKVEKRAKTSKTLVDIVALSAEDRVAELARMLGSGQSDISRQHALALLRGEAVEV
ncbi:MAG: DNA repair protein RecN, partial [Pseudomonadota bacterium]